MHLMAADISPSRSRRLRIVTFFAGLACLSTLSACSTTASNDTFDLSGIRISSNQAGPAVRGKQILVPPPSALKALDSENIVIRTSASEIQYLAKAQWGDSLTRMVQSRLVEALENSGRFGGVGLPGQGLAIDYQIVSDIRTFEVVASGGARAEVEISVKIVNDRNGTVKAQRVFSATVPVRTEGNSNYVKALDSAFANVAEQIVGWVPGAI